MERQVRMSIFPLHNAALTLNILQEEPRERQQFDMRMLV